MQKRGLLGIEELSTGQIQQILDRAKFYQPLETRTGKKLDKLQGRTIIHLFYEASTRTRTSFEIAAKRLGADTISITAQVSSVNKGESLLDTLNTLAAMRPDAIVMRHSASGAPHFLARYLEIPIINAGDGTHEHPTQALLDALTILDHKPSLAERTYRMEEAIAGADVIMMLRVQLERQRGHLFASDNEYFRFYGLRLEHLQAARPDAIVMHPGPINRGRELSSEVADFPRSVILNQVENGIAVRMAVLDLLLGGPAASASAGT